MKFTIFFALFLIWGVTAGDWDPTYAIGTFIGVKLALWRFFDIPLWKRSSQEEESRSVTGGNPEADRTLGPPPVANQSPPKDH